MDSFIHKCFINFNEFSVKLLELLCVEVLLPLFTKEPRHELYVYTMSIPVRKFNTFAAILQRLQPCRPKQFVLIFLNRGPQKVDFQKCSSACTYSQSKPQSCLGRCWLAQTKSTTGKTQTLQQVIVFWPWPCLKFACAALAEESRFWSSPQPERQHFMQDY